MNKDTIQGNWQEFKGKVKKQWGKLTDDDMAQINGRREELLGRIQQRYGYEKDKAETELSRFEEFCGCSENHTPRESKDRMSSHENDSRMSSRDSESRMSSHDNDSRLSRETGKDREKDYAKADRNTHAH